MNETLTNELSINTLSFQSTSMQRNKGRQPSDQYQHNLPKDPKGHLVEWCHLIGHTLLQEFLQKNH